MVKVVGKVYATSARCLCTPRPSATGETSWVRYIFASRVAMSHSSSPSQSTHSFILSLPNQLSVGRSSTSLSVQNCDQSPLLPVSSSALKHRARVVVLKDSSFDCLPKRPNHVPGRGKGHVLRCCFLCCLQIPRAFISWYLQVGVVIGQIDCQSQAGDRIANID